MPITSTTEVANIALSHMGSSFEISDLDSEDSNEAAVCRVQFESVRDAFLEEHPWTWAKKSAVLGLIEEEPTIEWAYSYRFPSDCIAPRRILTALGQSDPDPIPFDRGEDDTGGLIYCDLEAAELEYTRRVENMSLWPAIAIQALAWALAEAIAEPLSAKPERAREAERKAGIWLRKAMGASGNEKQRSPHPDSEFMRARL